MGDFTTSRTKWIVIGLFKAFIAILCIRKISIICTKREIFFEEKPQFCSKNYVIFWSKYERRSPSALIIFGSAARAPAHISPLGAPLALALTFLRAPLGAPLAVSGALHISETWNQPLNEWAKRKLLIFARALLAREPGAHFSHFSLLVAVSNSNVLALNHSTSNSNAK